MTADDKIATLIERHASFRASFVEERAGFMPIWIRNGERFTALSKDMEISGHLAKTVKKIKEVSNAE